MCAAPPGFGALHSGCDGESARRQGKYAVGNYAMSTKSVRSWLILVIAVAAIVAAYTAFGFLGVPRLVRSQLQSFVSEHYGRQAAIGEIRFNPYTFVLEARELSLPDTDGRPLLGFGRLLLDLDVATLWRRAPSFAAIEIERPLARLLIRPDGSLNIADLAKPFRSQSPQPAQASQPLRLFIDRLRIEAGQVEFEDRTHPSPFQARLQPISFELRDFSTTGQTGNHYTLQGASSADERFTWEGTFGLAPLASRGRFEVTNLQARTVWSYLRDSVGFELSSGLIGIAGDYDLDARSVLELKLNVHRVDVADLGVRPKGQDANYIDHAGLHIEETRLDLARERVDIGKVRLTGAAVRAWRNSNGAINLMALSSQTAPSSAVPGNHEPAAAPAASASGPAASASEKRSSWIIAAPDIAIQGLRLDVEDRFVAPTAAFTLAPVDVNVSGFSSGLGEALQVDAKIGIGKTGQLSAHAKAMPSTGAVSAHLDLSGFDLASLQPYINTYTQVTLLRGALNSALDIERDANGSLTVRGDTEVVNLHTIDNALRQDVIKWDQLRLAGIDYQSQPARLRIASVSARAPYARMIIAPDQTLNISRLMSPAPGSAPAAVQTVQTAAGGTRAPGGNPGAMAVSIGTVRIADGSANFADFWIQPNYAVSVQGMNGTIVGLSSDPKSRAKVSLEGKVDRYAPANIGGEINLLSAALFTDMKVSFKGVEMTSVTPYSGRFAGYKIEKGKLSIDVAYRVENRQLKADQHFVIDQLQLGERVESADAIHLPLRIAIALLKDRNGVIDVELPVSGSLDDPKFRLGPIIWKAITGLLAKVATAPFALLGRLFGGGEEMNQVDFEAGKAALEPAAQERMAAVVKAMHERPELQIEVPTSYSAELDRPAMTRQKLDEKLLQLAQQRATARKQGHADDAAGIATDPAQRFDLLLAQYRIDFSADAAPPPLAAGILAARKKKGEPPPFETANAELMAAIAEKQVVTEVDLEALAQARAHAVQDALLASGEVDPARVFILGAKETPAAGGKVRLELGLR